MAANGERLDVTRLKFVELKQELSVRGMNSKGSNHELIQKLQEYFQEHGEEEEEETNIEVVTEEDFSVEAPEEEDPNEKEIVKSEQKEHGTIKTVTTRIGSMTNTERLKWRTMRFGKIVCEDFKKRTSVAQFGVPHDNIGSNKSMTEVDKLRKRKERFGIVMLPVGIVNDIEDKKKKRAKRFGF
ncbi:SAP domain-containing ribonucleoprotein-like [Heptranchias perlo]|uniref:SAP domain-containing ribonucleoprotein-like n=1 Tax=Heptranchias perlo TaxID=212740 RepID=UPI003559D27A